MDLTDDGFLLDLWSYNRKGQTVYPCLYRPAGASRPSLYVTLTGSRNDYRQMGLDQFLTFLADDAFSHRGRARMKPRGVRAGANGFSVRKSHMSNRLRKELERIRASEPEIHPEEVREPEAYLEGSTRTVSVNSFERNRKARDRCIQHYGIACSVCGFDFRQTYGDIG